MGIETYWVMNGNIVELCELKEIAMGNKPRRYDGHGMRPLDEGEYVEYAVWLAQEKELEKKSKTLHLDIHHIDKLEDAIDKLEDENKALKEEVTTVIDVDGNSETCYGRFVPIATVQGTQAGSMSGIGSAAIQGGAIVGGAYLLADGIRDSGDETTNNTSSNGGSSSARSDAFGQGNSSAAASGGNGGNGYGYGGKGGSGGSVINKGHRQ